MRKSSSLAALAAVVLSAHFAVAAQMVDLRALPKYGDSSLMSFNRREARGTLPLMTFGLPSPAPSFTAVFWTCVDWRRDPEAVSTPMVEAMVSTEPALYVSEGGDYSPDLLGDAYWPVERGGLGATLPLSSTGTWSANCLPASYDMPADFAHRDDWQYGCYTLNIITDTDLTVTVGGEERNIAASNEMQQVAFLCVSADRSITVAAADADADVYLCAAESPLRQFHDMQLFQTTSGAHYYGVERALTNEWRMVVLRGAIVQGGAAVELNALTFAAVDPSPIEDSTSTKELWRPRADRCFARHSRIGFVICALVGLKDHSGKYIRRNVWGAKIYPEWLDDDLILSIHDRDWAEMQRRGFSTHYRFSQ